MANGDSSFFGPTPGQVINREIQGAVTQGVGIPGGPNFGARQAGAGLAGLGGAILRKFGIGSSPEQEKAERMQHIKEEANRIAKLQKDKGDFQGAGLDLKGYGKIVMDVAIRAGEPELAQKAAQMVADFDFKEAKLEAARKGTSLVDAQTQLVKAQTRAANQDEPVQWQIVVTGGSEVDRQFNLNIPQGEPAIVKMTALKNGTVMASVQKPFGGTGPEISVITTVGGKIGAEQQAKRLGTVIERGTLSAEMEPILFQLAELLKGGVQAGGAQPAITGLQNFVADFGINLQTVATNLGMGDIGNLTDKQDLHRLSRQVIINTFEKFKGNLNREEVKLAVDSFASLGISEESNINAVAAGLAAAQIARERASEAASIPLEDVKAKAAFERQILSGTDTTKFLELKAKFAREMRGESEKVPDGVPTGSRKVGVSKRGNEVWRDPGGDLWEID